MGPVVDEFEPHELTTSIHTFGRLLVGGKSSGTLTDGVELKPYEIRPGLIGGDWFRLLRLQTGRLYRITVSFTDSALPRGGAIQMYEQDSSYTSNPRRRIDHDSYHARGDLWDVNSGGTASFDFTTIGGKGSTTSRFYIQIHPYKEDSTDQSGDDGTFYYGPYTVTLTDITDD